MDQPIGPHVVPHLIPTPPDIVRATIAQLILGAPPSPKTVGEIELYPHQLEALNRIQSAIATFNGALLSDDVGLGKTYVALALAITYKRTLIVTPAILKSMWMHARTRTYRNTSHIADTVSIESLSRRTPARPYDLIIIDEAHHARTPQTKRYAALTSLCDNAHVLLMSATPIHNTNKDITTLLALFLKDRALTLTPADLSRILIRRTHTHTKLPQTIPHRHPTRWFESPTTHTLLSAIINLPPPLPLHSAGNTPHLAQLSLIRQWSSSDHALHNATRRRIARATALLQAIDAGCYPTPTEIKAWLFAEDALQLAFPELIASPHNGPSATLPQLRTTIQQHTQALTHLLTQIPSPSPADARKARGIRRIRQQHHLERIVVFSQYIDTIAILFTLLKHDGHVAALTGKRGYIATGPIRRTDIINRFAPSANQTPHPHPRESITLLLTTDILSEGVNLQDASVVIHLDIPWTAAILDQRVGRVARIGSLHQQVTTYGLLPPPAANHILRTTAIIQQKAHLTHQSIGGRPIDVPNALESETITSKTSNSADRSRAAQTSSTSTGISTPEHTEAIRAILRTWLRNPTVPPQISDRDRRAIPSAGIHTNPQRRSDQVITATQCAHTNGFIAVCLIDDTPTLLASLAPDPPSTAPTLVHKALVTASDPSRNPQAALRRSSTDGRLSASKDSSENTLPDNSRSALNAITLWLTDLHATTDAGLTHLPPVTHATTRHTRAQLRTLARDVATTPWPLRHEIATRTSETRTHLTRPVPTLTFHLVALLLLTAPD